MRGDIPNAATMTKNARVLCTPGFQDKMSSGDPRKFGLEHMLTIIHELTKTQPVIGTEPSMVVGDPDIGARRYEDDGRTLRIPTWFRFWAMRGDHEPQCDCGCGGVPVITFLLPEEN